MPTPKPVLCARGCHRWAVILAGGDGTRLLPLTRKITGDDRPKQFCALTGGETLLDQTRRRVGRMVADDRILLLLTRTQEPFYACQVAGILPSCLLVQPYNHGTAPAIAYSLMRLRDRDPDAVVAFFPSDHHFEDDEALAAQMEVAFAQADQDLDHVVLLGITPEAPEEAYGWIEPGKGLGKSLFEVRRFWEKPTRTVAAQLLRRGCLWNSFIMVGRVGAFMNLLRQALPSLLTLLEALWAEVIRGSKERAPEHEALLSLYASIPATNFSDDVLSVSASALTVLRANDLGWSDLGEPQRVISVIKNMGVARGGGRGLLHRGLEIPA